MCVTFTAHRSHLDFNNNLSLIRMSGGKKNTAISLFIENATRRTGTVCGYGLSQTEV
jgi:hypothetical protein